jgi:hypothetical protein
VKAPETRRRRALRIRPGAPGREHDTTIARATLTESTDTQHVVLADLGTKARTPD